MSIPQASPEEPSISRSDTYPKAHATEGTLTSDARVTQNHINEPLSHDDLQRKAEELQRAHTRIKAAVEESQKAAREVCANIFILQNDLDNEDAYHSVLVNTITSLVGIDVMQGCLDSDPRQIEKKPQRTSASYHVITVAPPGYGAAGSPKGSKRHRDDEDVALDLESPHNHKRPRLGEPSSNDNTTKPTVVVPRTILDYSSEEDETDDTYSDSNGTERDFIDDPYSYYDSHGLNPYGVLRYGSEQSTHEESDPDDSQNDVPWSSIPDFGDDSSDSDYQPPDLDPEDIWELETIRQPSKPEYIIIWDVHPLFTFTFWDELDDCSGVMSDGGLSTDNPDEGHPLGILQRPYIPDYVTCFPASLHGKRKPSWTLETGSPHIDFKRRLAGLLESGHSQFRFDDCEWTCFEESPFMIRQTGEMTGPEAEASS